MIATDLLKNKVSLLIELLQKHKRAIWKTIVDIVGIHVGICTHNIWLDSECKPNVEYQQSLDSLMEKVV